MVMAISGFALVVISPSEKTFQAKNSKEFYNPEKEKFLYIVG